jgi:hypothetical protein
MRLQQTHSSTDCVYSVSHSGAGYGASVPPEKDRYTVAMEVRIGAKLQTFIMSRTVYVSELSPIDSNNSIQFSYSHSSSHSTKSLEHRKYKNGDSLWEELSV